MEKARKSTKVLESKGHSALNKYEMMRLENQRADGRPDEERIRQAFQVFDDLLPKLGVYTRILNKIRDDIHGAVYSEDLTTDKEGGVIQLPYFTVVRREKTQEDDKLDVLTEQLETVKQRLFVKHKNYEESQAKINELQEEIEELHQRLNTCDELLTDKTAEIMRLEEQNATESRRAQEIEEELRDEIEGLKEDLELCNRNNDELSRYKRGYDDLYQAFLDTSDMDDAPQKHIRPVISTRRANLITNIDSAQKLEEQIMSVLNTAIEEFDRFLEEHKTELMCIENKEDLTSAEYDVQELDIEQADQELETMQERFRNTVGDISNELQLLKQHGIMLMEQLQTMEQNKPTLQKKNKEKSKLSDSLQKSDSILSAGLQDTNGEEEADADPFIPQERVFSKYAAMLYTSSNSGRSFDEFKDAKFCQSCGEKTVICPHKLPGMDKVFSLPLHCTHIKVARPKVRINRELIDEIMKPQQSPEFGFDIPSTAGTYTRRMESILTLQTPATSRGSPSLVGSEAHMESFSSGRPKHSMHRLFDDYKDRTHMERNIPRQLSLERTLSQIQQFWAYMVWLDDNGDENDVSHSVLDHVYLFMRERYTIEDVMFLCAYDLLASVVEYAISSKTVQVFGHILAGNLDGAVFRYTMLMCDFIKAIDWKEVEDFRAFASVVYPFLGEDDVETLQMTYTSFSENKISGQLVCDFLMHIILKYREPCFLEMENKVIPFQAQETGQPSLTEKEFRDAVETLVPLANDKLCNKLYCEAEKAVRIDGFQGKVPVMRTAQICAYLYLVQISKTASEHVANRVEQWRERPHSTSSEMRPLDGHSAEDESFLISMKEVKQLAQNIARRTRLRQERIENQQDIEWQY